MLATAKDLGIAVVAYSSLSGWPRGVGARADPLLRQLAARRGVKESVLLREALSELLLKYKGRKPG